MEGRRVTDDSAIAAKGPQRLPKSTANHIEGFGAEIQRLHHAGHLRALDRLLLL